MGAKIITNTILGVPYYNTSIMGPKTLFQLLRPLDYCVLEGSGGSSAYHVLKACSSQGGTTPGESRTSTSFFLTLGAPKDTPKTLPDSVVIQQNLNHLSAFRLPPRTPEVRFSVTSVWLASYFSRLGLRDPHIGDSGILGLSFPPHPG